MKPGSLQIEYTAESTYFCICSCSLRGLDKRLYTTNQLTASINRNTSGLVSQTV
jgi:hypothetical protein